MAITKLMHMKEAKGNPPKHLINAINYILDVKHGGCKCDYGNLIYSNVGAKADEIISAFLDTKQAFGKTEGRQGYHFVISFENGECTNEECFELAKEFCEQYLGDNYDFVIAAHNDKAHPHAHVVFNSINRTTGLKYQYKKGDWEKYIQPITDKICQEHGLMPLVYDESNALTYAEWNHKRDEKNINWSHIVMADIDYAIDKSSSPESFLLTMKQLGYEISNGTRNGKLNFTFVFKDQEGKIHRRRASTLPVGYRYEDIIERTKGTGIEHSPYYEKLGKIMKEKSGNALETYSMIKHTRTYYRMYQAVSYYSLPNPFAVPPKEVRTDMKRLNNLIEECAYLKKHMEKGGPSVFERAEQVDNRLHQLYVRRRNLYETRDEYKDLPLYDLILKYLQMDEVLSNSNDWGEAEELLQDKMGEIEEKIPAVCLQNESQLQRCKYEIAALVKEKKLLKNITTTERGGYSIVKKESPKPKL